MEVDLYGLFEWSLHVTIPMALYIIYSIIKNIKEATKMKETARTEWDTKQLQEDFTVQSFLAPIVFVTRKKDGVSGTMDFTHSPRVYFNWRASNE